MRLALRLIWIGLLVTGGFITLVGQSGLEAANGNVCVLWKAISGLPFVTCHLERLIARSGLGIHLRLGVFADLG